MINSAQILLSYQIGKEGIFRTECAAFPLLASAALHLWLEGFKRNGPLFGIASLGFLLSIVVSRKLGGSIAIDDVIKTFCIAVMVNTLHGHGVVLLLRKPLACRHQGLEAGVG